MTSLNVPLRASRPSTLRSLRTIPSHLHHPPFRLPQRRRISAYGYEQAKALTFQKYGDPKDVLSLHSHSISPAHSNLLTLRFLASPINPADINQIQGVYPSKPTFTTALGTSDPIAVGGNEGVAEVIAAGEKVRGLRRGDWVVMRRQGFGTWRTHAQTTEEEVLKIEDKGGLTPVQAGTVSVNPCTAYRMLRDFVQLKEGEWFIQNGANSGVGRAAIQLGRLWGYKSINVVRARPEEELAKLKEDLQTLGADVVITDKELEGKEIKDKIAQWTNGGREPIRLGLNCVGGKQVNAMAKQLTPNASLVTYGGMSKEPTPLPTGLLIFKNIRFEGFWVSRWGDQNPEEKKRTIEEVLQLYKEDKFKGTALDEIPWEWETKAETLVEAVAGTLGGFRKGKGVFVFGKT
jgi:trans-2-enoyl-CoA reductase